MVFAKLIPILVAALLAGPAGSTAPPSGQGRWSWPLSPKPHVLRTFDPPDKPWLSGHRGVDLGAAHDAGPVTAAPAVASPADGVVSFAGIVVDRPVLTIDHGGGLRSSFEPVDTGLKPGDHVTKGQVIGNLAAAPAHCQGTCLHWGVRRGDDYVNPLAFILDLRPSILLPIH